MANGRWSQTDGVCISSYVNPIHCPSLYNFRAERYTDAPTNSIFSGPLTRLLSMLCVLMKILSRAIEKKKTKRPEGFRFHTFIGRFQATSWQ